MFQSDGTENLLCGIYLRVSTADQKEKHGIELQKSKCTAMATLKGWEIKETYIDDGISGTIAETERPGFSSMLKDIENGKIQAIIVYALDRLGRRTQIVLRCIENLSQKGIKVVSCRENLDTSTPTGNFMLTIFAALSQLERDTIVERMKAGTEERRKKDGDIGGHVPLGYKRKDNKIVILPHKADIIRYIFKKRFIERWYISEIVDELNNRNIPPPTKRGKKWSTGSLQRILGNEAKYLGGIRNESNFRWPRILPIDFNEQEKKANEAFDEYNKTKLMPNETPDVQPSIRVIKRSNKARRDLEHYWNNQLLEDKDVSFKMFHSKPEYYRIGKGGSKIIIPEKDLRPSALHIRIPSPKQTRRIKQYDLENQEQ